MIISMFTPLIRVIYGIPLAVIGGLEIYLFGAIAAQGMAIMIDKKVDMFSSKNIAVIASIMVIGIGGNYAFGGNIPFFGLNVPCIAGAAIFRHHPQRPALHRREEKGRGQRVIPFAPPGFRGGRSVFGELLHVFALGNFLRDERETDRKECIILKRLIGLLLALAFLCPCLALAETAGPRTEAGGQVAAYLDEAGVNYQLDTSTEYDVFIRAYPPSRAEGVDSIIVGALVSDERVTFETGTLVTADMSDMAALYQALNAINADAAFVRFVLNTNDGSVIARMDSARSGRRGLRLRGGTLHARRRERRR